MDLDDEEVQATKNLKNKCKCCEEIEYIKELAKYSTSNIERILKATITSFNKRKYDKQYFGRITYNSFELNYCPMCGRKLGD